MVETKGSKHKPPRRKRRKGTDNTHFSYQTMGFHPKLEWERNDHMTMPPWKEVVTKKPACLQVEPQEVKHRLQLSRPCNAEFQLWTRLADTGDSISWATRSPSLHYEISREVRAADGEVENHSSPASILTYKAGRRSRAGVDLGEDHRMSSLVVAVIWGHRRSGGGDRSRSFTTKDNADDKPNDRSRPELAPATTLVPPPWWPEESR